MGAVGPSPQWSGDPSLTGPWWGCGSTARHSPPPPQHPPKGQVNGLAHRCLYRGPRGDLRARRRGRGVVVKQVRGNVSEIPMSWWTVAVGVVAGYALALAIGYAVLCGWIADRDWNQAF